METARRSLKTLILGVWITMVVVTIIGMILTKDALGFLYGEALGSVLATAAAYHIYHTLDVALDLDKKHAANYARRGSVIRSLITIGVLLAGFYLRAFISPLGIFLGLMGLKVSVYLQPLINKFYKSDN